MDEIKIQAREDVKKGDVVVMNNVIGKNNQPTISAAKLVGVGETPKSVGYIEMPKVTPVAKPTFVAPKIVPSPMPTPIEVKKVEVKPEDKVIGTINIIVYENIPPSVRFSGEVYGRYVKVVISQLPKALRQYMLAMAAKAEGKPLTDLQKATMGK